MCKKSSFLKPINIVMLDYDTKLLNVVQTYFATKKINILPSQSLNDSYSKILIWFPDCIIVDIAMPNQTGHKLIKCIQSDNRLKNIPCIFLTANGLTEDRIKGYNLGCNAYISKPFDPEELEAIIHNLISQNNRTLNLSINIYAKLKKIRETLLKQYDFSKYSQRISLTYEEYKVLKNLLKNKNVTEIAYEYNLTPRNIEKHISRILNKTSTKNIKQLKSLPWNVI